MSHYYSNIESDQPDKSVTVPEQHADALDQTTQNLLNAADEIWPIVSEVGAAHYWCTRDRTRGQHDTMGVDIEVMVFKGLRMKPTPSVEKIHAKARIHSMSRSVVDSRRVIEVLDLLDDLVSMNTILGAALLNIIMSTPKRPQQVAEKGLADANRVAYNALPRIIDADGATEGDDPR